MNKATSISVVLVCCTIFLSNLSAQNPIPNYSFENWTNGLPDDWEVFNQEFFSKVPGHTGNAVHLDPLTGGDNHIYTLPLYFPINQHYNHFKLHYRGDFSPGGNRARIGYLVFDADRQKLGSGFIYFNINHSTNDWTEIVSPPVSIQLEGDPVWAYIEITIYQGQNWIEIDDLELLNIVEIEEPQAGDIWIAGEADTIRWNGGGPNNTFMLEYSEDNGNSYKFIDLVHPADTGKYGWDIPDNILSTKMKIRIKDNATSAVLAESDRFKIKPYIITRLDNNGDYITYNIDVDRWNYGNNMNEMFPYSWWFNKFDYKHGIDPFINSTYSQWQGFGVFADAFRSDFPDWISFVNAFSVNNCYTSTNLGIYSPIALLKWKAIKKAWSGSCFGIANANALAFSQRDEFEAHYPNYPNFADPINVQSDTNVVKVITELFTKQFGRLTYLHQDLYYSTDVDNTLDELKLMLEEDNTSIRTLYMRNNTPNTVQAHCVLPYKLKQNPDNERYYDLWVWDNSYSNNTDAIIRIGTYDPGYWEPMYGWNGWGGYYWFFLEPVSDLYLNDASLPKTSESENQLFLPMAVEIDVTNKVDIIITDSFGNNTSYQNNNLVNEIPSGLPLIYINGSEGPPYGYLLGIKDYSIELNNFTSDTVETYFFTDNKAFSYERYDANEQQTDDLLFDGGIEVNNQDEAIKSIRLMNIVDGADDERVFIFRGLNVSKDESVKIINPDDYNLDLISRGIAKTYDIELNHASELGLMTFNHSDVEISKNTTHKLMPNWGDFADLHLQILVDEDNDGTIDDTLNLENQGTGVEEHGSNILPTEFNLEQNYPNPFNPSTKIEYRIQKSEFVSLKVYDVLGREIATLVNKEQKAGYYEVQFTSNNYQLTSGVYFYRIQAGDFIKTKKMILLR